MSLLHLGVTGEAVSGDDDRGWRVGRKVPRNIYKNDEPVAMLATPELAAEIVAGMNDVKQLRETTEVLQIHASIYRDKIAKLHKDLACDVDGSCRQCHGTGEVIIWAGGSISTREPVPCGLCEGRATEESKP